MAKPREYKPTLFDRHGPGAVQIVRAFAYGLLVFGLTAGVLFTQGAPVIRSLVIGLIAGVITGGVGWFLTELFAHSWKRVAIDGASTPYREQFSYQQALVMKGEVDAALESFEAIMVEQPAAVDVRIKAAELYVAGRKNYLRAAEIFREARRIPTITRGEDVYVTNRLADLLMGPLENPGRAMVELRRLIHKHPTTVAADHARSALASLKARANHQDSI